MNFSNRFPVSALRSSVPIRCYLITLTLILLTLTPTRLFSQKPAEKVAWTLMIYQDMDNTLEAPQLADVKEMMKIGSSEKVQVIMLCDRSKESEPKDRYSDEPVGGLANWSGAKLLRVEKEKLTVLADWGEVNMASPDTLSKFVMEAAKNYPAERYGLIIADHGSGWDSFCVDESSGEKTMSLKDLRVGLEPFVKQNGEFELIGFDACLMGSFETAQTLEPIARYMVASEELAPVQGWNYDTLIKTLVNKPSSNGFDLGRSIIDAYTIHFRDSRDPLVKFASLGVTLSLIDLEQFSGLQGAVSELADKCIVSLRNGRAGWLRVARARVASEEYGILGPRTDTGDEEMHDLMHIALILQQSDDPSIAEAAAKTVAAVRKTVKHLTRGTCRPNAAGLSIYFPTDGISLQNSIGSRYFGRTYSREARWGNFLSLYAVALNNFSRRPNLQPIQATARVSTRERPVEIAARVMDDDIDKVHFVLFAHDGADILTIGRLPTFLLPGGRLGHRVDGKWFHIVNGVSGVTCPISHFEPLDTKGDRYLAYVDIQIRRARQKDWISAQCVFYTSTETGRPRGQLLYAFASTPQGPLQVSLKAGDAIKAVYTRINANATVTEWTAGDRGTLAITNPRNLSLEWGLVEKGIYQAGFEVVNYAGIPAIRLAEVIMED